MNLPDMMEEYAPVLLRVSMSLVFLWFGISQITDTDNYLGYLPDFIFSSGYAKQFVISNGIFEIVTGTMLLFGIFTRIAALLLSLHLFAIAFEMRYGDTAIRDFGLALATLSIVMRGGDIWCLENKIKKKWDMVI